MTFQIHFGLKDKSDEIYYPTNLAPQNYEELMFDSAAYRESLSFDVDVEGNEIKSNRCKYHGKLTIEYHVWLYYSAL